jgi:hypothetical protein
MKRCPKCQSTYTDDTLGFCLQDGTSLANVRDLLPSEETLELRFGATQAIDSSAPTVIDSKSPVHISEPPTAGTVIATPATSKALVGGVFLVAVLLIALIGITSAVLLRGVLWDKDRGSRRNRNLNGQQANDNSGVPAPPLKVTASASSTRAPQGGNRYFPENLVDEDLDSAWIEGVDGPGRGSWIQCDFDREVSLNSIRVYPGYFKSQTIWAKNNRVSAATIIFSDGTSMQVTFPDQMQPQDIAANGKRTRSVRLQIDDFYGGSTDFDDTAISEIKFDWKP